MLSDAIRLPPSAQRKALTDRWRRRKAGSRYAALARQRPNEFVGPRGKRFGIGCWDYRRFVVKDLSRVASQRRFREALSGGSAEVGGRMSSFCIAGAPQDNSGNVGAGRGQTGVGASGRLRPDGVVAASAWCISLHTWVDRASGGKLFRHLRRRGKSYDSRGPNEPSHGVIPGWVDIGERLAIVEERPLTTGRSTRSWARGVAGCWFRQSTGPRSSPFGKGMVGRAVAPWASVPLANLSELPHLLASCSCFEGNATALPESLPKIFNNNSPDPTGVGHETC